MAIETGWIKISRQIQDHWVWSDAEYLKAWLDLIISANFHESKIIMDGQEVIIERGQLHTALRTLANKWKWSKSKVHRFLKLLQNANMIVQKAGHHGDTITIINYDKFQSSESKVGQEWDMSGTRAGHERDNPKKERREEGKNKPKKDNPPTPQTGGYVEACLVIDYLNQKTDRSFRKEKSSLKFIIDRLKEGNTIDDCKAVIDLQTKKWLNDPERKQYLRPCTLFNASKFASYIGQVELPPQITTNKSKDIFDNCLKIYPANGNGAVLQDDNSFNLFLIAMNDKIETAREIYRSIKNYADTQPEHPRTVNNFLKDNFWKSYLTLLEITTEDIAP